MLLPLSLLILASPWPSNLSVKAAGIAADQREPFRVAYHDPKSGYFAYKTFECDGGHVSVSITKDRRNVASGGYDTTRFGRKAEYEETPIKDKAIPLSTGNGVKIGMSKAAVLKKLGKPVRTAVRGKKGEFWCALYKKAQMEDKETGQVLRNTYIFKNGKLIEISINLDSVPGCGDDSLSDEGWPWTSF